MILCRDCRYREREKCMHPKSSMEVQDWVNGGMIKVQYSVSLARMLGDCGQDGKLFEPREVGFV